MKKKMYREIYNSPAEAIAVAIYEVEKERMEAKLNEHMKHIEEKPKGRKKKGDK